MRYSRPDDATLLIGRNAHALVDDLATAERDGLFSIIRAELDAVEAVIRARSFILAPTVSRAMAIELLPAAAMLCHDEREIDQLLLMVRDWIESLGDVRHRALLLTSARHAAADILAAASATGDHATIRDADAARAELADLEEASSLTIALSFNAIVGFRIHDANTLVTVLEVPRRRRMIVGVVEINSDDGARRSAPAPEPVLAV